MSEIAIFAFDSAAVRTLDLNGEPWFVATDIAKILGYRNAPDMVRNLDDDEADTHNLRISSENGVEQDREVTIINESGLYACILKSRRPEAKAFRKWVTSEVLPAIRKRGGYTAPGAEPAPQFITSNLAHGADLAVAADRTFRSFLRAARSAGLALPQALRKANQQTLSRTGMNMLEELGVDTEEMEAASASVAVDGMPPELQAVAEWARKAEPARFYTLAEVLLLAADVSIESDKGRRLAGRLGQLLRGLGFRSSRMRSSGRQVTYWHK